MASPRPIDRFVPDPEARSHHSIRIEAPPERVWDALWEVDLGEVLVVRLLIGLRTLPKRLTGGSSLRREPRPTLVEMQRAGFGQLAETPGKEVVFGVEGRFWSPAANIDPFDRESFEAPVREGRARAVWGFEVRPEDGGTRLDTETLVACGDASSRRKFRAYWLFVSPFSGLIRVVMLRAIRRQAEDNES